MLVTIGYGIDSNPTRYTGIGIAFVSFVMIMITFLIDFRTTMIVNETAGDEYSLLGAEKLKKILDSRGIEYEEGKGREYYLYLVREEND